MATLVSVETAAMRLGLKPVTVRLWIARRRLACVRLRRRVLVPESEIDRLIERGTIPAAEERL
jgi:excisionase family DNA binding protein